jgi:hypothetical protein
VLPRQWKRSLSSRERPRIRIELPLIVTLVPEKGIGERALM